MSIAHPATSRLSPGTPALLDSLDSTLTGKAVLAVCASAFIALCAHVSFPLPFTPVPLTLGNMAVILVGLFLSPATAFAALIVYLAEGAAGLPVFNPGGLGGVAQLLGPTGGFLFAYPLAALVASALVRACARFTSRFAAGTIAATAGTAIVLALGVTWLGLLLHLAPATALKLGVAPFVPGEVVKILAAAGIFTSLRQLRKA